ERLNDFKIVEQEILLPGDLVAGDRVTDTGGRNEQRRPASPANDTLAVAIPHGLPRIPANLPELRRLHRLFSELSRRLRARQHVEQLVGFGEQLDVVAGD